MISDICIKFLDAGGIGPYSVHSFSVACPGEWLPPRRVVACKSGYHYTTARDLSTWVRSEAYEIEARGAVDLGDKWAAESIRFVRRIHCDEATLRLFAADCAEAVLPFFEAVHPGDHRPRAAIAAVRAYAREIGAAAQAAAGNAARAAARAANRYATLSSSSGNAAWAAAWAASHAWDAEGNAAWYAAWAVTRAAAWAAAWAATHTWDAEGNAAWYAAGNATLGAVNRLLLAYMLDDGVHDARVVLYRTCREPLPSAHHHDFAIAMATRGRAATQGGDDS